MRISVPNIPWEAGSLYVKGMTHHAQLDRTNEGVIEFWDKPANGTDNLLALTAFSAGEEKEFKILVDDGFGRRLSVGSGGTATVDVTGLDYLGQKVTAQFSVANNNVTSLKAFKYVTRVKSSAGVSIRLGRGAGFGLPFTARAVLAEYAGTTLQAAGTFVVPDQTDPATLATGDPRGIYVPTTALNGTNDFVIKVLFDPNQPNGLYGVQHV